MDHIDKKFENRQPDTVVHKLLYKLYMHHLIAEMQENQMNGRILAEKLQSMSEYLKFLGALNDLVVQEISDISDQLYGPL